MKTMKVLLVGIGGYGNVYVNFFKNGLFEEDVILVGIADPYAEKSPGYSWIVENKIPIYPTPEAYFQENTADLTIIAAPTEYHLPYSITAMKNGSHVLCEKPLTAVVQDLDALEAAREQYGKTLGVGFQWSFSKTMLGMKADIEKGLYGKPKLLKTMISWPRVHAYYGSSNWKGRIRNSEGGHILDSIVTNATAHYLHNILFLLGESTDKAVLPSSCKVELYQAKDIESFDTCCIRGNLGEGEFLYLASHATQHNMAPKCCYIFEKGVIRFNEDQEDNEAVGYLNDGQVIRYGNPFTPAEESQKVQAMIAHIRTGAPIPCTPLTARPHLLLCNAIFDFGRVTNFPSELLVSVQEPTPNTYCQGLTEDLLQCHRQGLLPSENKLSWSVPPVTLPLDGYEAYQDGDLARQCPMKL